MRRTCTPEEREQWWRELSSIARERRVAVIQMLSEVVDDCRWCDGPVRRCDSRTMEGDRLLHLRCSQRYGEGP
jgi:predicted DNA-binding ribbon-helix-helix protein